MFTALIVSIIAGFLRDFIPSWFSKFNDRVKRKNYRRKRILARMVRAFMQSPEYYQSAAFKLQREAMFIFALIALSVALGPINKFYTDYPEYDPLGAYLPKISSGVTGILASISLIILVPRFYTSTRNYLLLSIMHRRFRRRAIRYIRKGKGRKE